MGLPRHMVYSSLETSLSAGIPIAKSLRLVGRGKSPLQRFVDDWADAVEQNLDQAQVIAESKDLGQLEKKMILGAIRMGRMSEALQTLTRYFKEIQKNEKKFRGGMIKPILIYHIASFVLPVTGFIVGGNSIWQYLMNVLSLLMWLYVPSAIGLFIYRSSGALNRLRKPIEKLYSVIPALGKGLVALAYGRFSKALSFGLQSGLSFEESYSMGLEATDNEMIKEKLDVLVRAQQGLPANQVFGTGVPEMFRMQWDTGRQSGQLDRTLEKFSDDQTEEGFRQLDLFASWLPKVVYFFMMMLMVAAIFQAAGGIRG